MRPTSKLLSSAFEENAAMVHAAAWRITGRAEDADDVLQAVFLSLTKLPAERWPENPGGYLRRAAVHAALDVLRRRKRLAEDEMPSDPPGAPAGPDEESRAAGLVDRARIAARLREALALLSPLEAEVFALRCFEDRSNVEIAQLIDRTPNLVGVTLHAARAKLRAALAETSAGDRRTGAASPNAQLEAGAAGAAPLTGDAP